MYDVICTYILYLPCLNVGMRNCANLPAEMKIDYIRLYQDKHAADHTLSCSPPDFPTSAFITDHSERYKPWDVTQKIRLDGRHDRTSPIYFWIFLLGILGLFCVILALIIDYFLLNNKCFINIKERILLQSTSSEKRGIGESQHSNGRDVSSSGEKRTIIGGGIATNNSNRNEMSPLLAHKSSHQ